MITRIRRYLASLNWNVLTGGTLGALASKLKKCITSGRTIYPRHIHQRADFVEKYGNTCSKLCWQEKRETK